MLAALTLLAGCQKTPELSDQPFTVTIKSVQARAMWADIIPEYNDFGYNYGIVTVKEFEQTYKTDEALIAAKDAVDKDYWEKNLKEKMSFRDAFLYTGAYFVKGEPLEPETEYYIFTFPYDSKDNPVCKVVKERFKTTAFKPSSLSFTVSMNGSVATVVPSNNDDSYYFDFDTVESINTNFNGDPSYFYSYIIYKYEEYGFMSETKCKGVTNDDFKEYFNLKPNQEFYLVCSGYDNGITSEYTIFKVTYVGENLPGKVERVK